VIEPFPPLRVNAVSEGENDIIWVIDRVDFKGEGFDSLWEIGGFNI
jgi:hypothetical protein